MIISAPLSGPIVLAHRAGRCQTHHRGPRCPMSEVAEPKRADYHCVSLLAAVLLYERLMSLIYYDEAFIN